MPPREPVLPSSCVTLALTGYESMVGNKLIFILCMKIIGELKESQTHLSSKALLLDLCVLGFFDVSMHF